MATEDSPVHHINARFPICVIVEGIFTEDKPEQPSKVPSSMFVTEDGIIISFSPIQSLNALNIDNQRFVL